MDIFGLLKKEREKNASKEVIAIFYNTQFEYNF